LAERLICLSASGEFFMATTYTYPTPKVCSYMYRP